MDAIVTPVTELCKCLIPFLCHQIGYVVKYKKKLEQLKKKIQELEAQRDDVQRLIDEAERNREDINKVVKAWLDKVELALSYEENVTKCCWCSCVVGSRYNLGKKAERKLDDINELINHGRSFNRDNISVRSSVGENLMSSAAGANNDRDDFVHFASREHLKDEIMVALREDGTNLIGVYGMGGVGKTTLVNQVYKQVKELKLFNDVVMAPAISQELDIKKIQNDLAEMLGLDRLKSLDNAVARAEMLSGRLKNGKNLVILDDLWSYVNFSDLGIPCGENCKVIITTRRLQVCELLGSRKNVNVEELSAPDSWYLFKKNIGDLPDSHILETTVREIANECGGLPVALITLGRGLRGKGKSVCDNTLQELRNSEPPNIEGMDVKVYRSIKLSYDYLENEDLRKFFLLCCIFPEDHVIGMAESMAYMLDDDQMFRGRKTLKQNMDKVRTISARLVDSCLLLGKIGEDGDLETVSMHDVIRDVAIHIASKECNGFHVKASVDLRDWPETKESLLSSSGTAKCLRLSRMKDANESSKVEIADSYFQEKSLATLNLRQTGISSLPSSFSRMKDEINELQDDESNEFQDDESNESNEFHDYGKLDANESSKLEIANSYFQGKESLSTLDLTQTGISSLPSSSSLLVNLKSLYLDGCKFDQPSDISVIGKLKKLEILSLVCALPGLPKELRGLTNLRSLNLELAYCDWKNVIFTIPQNVISSFSQLEYLNMNGRIIEMEVEGRRNGSNVCLEEVASLSRLSCLNLRLSNYVYEVESEITVSPKHGFVGSLAIAFSDTTPVLDNRTVCDSMKVLIQKIEKLILVKCPGLKSVGQVFGVGLHYLKELEVNKCNEMEYLMSFAEAEVPISRQDLLLETITLWDCGLKVIFSGPIPVGFVNKLSTLSISFCNDMVCIFDRNLGRRVPNLKSLDLCGCDGLKDVFNLEIGMSTTLDNQEGLSDVTIFSKLTRMELKYLPNLENIWKGNNIPFRCFENLEEILVSNCDKLRYLFTPSMARNLQNLKSLSISYCSSMEILITSTVQMVYADENQSNLLIFPNLISLTINWCINLKQLWVLKNLGKDDDDDQLARRASILDFPYLERLKVLECENLESIHLTHKCTLKLKMIIGDSEEWFHQRLEWEDPSDKLLMRPLFEAKGSLLELIPLRDWL